MPERAATASTIELVRGMCRERERSSTPSRNRRSATNQCEQSPERRETLAFTFSATIFHR